MAEQTERPRADREDPGGWFTPYRLLPGTRVGPHDSIELTGDPDVINDDPDIGLLSGVTWWHHADKPPAGKRPKGGRCGGGNLANHTLTSGTATVDDLSAIDISPSLLCSMCGRHIFIKDGEVSDLGDAHRGWQHTSGLDWGERLDEYFARGEDDHG